MCCSRFLYPLAPQQSAQPERSVRLPPPGQIEKPGPRGEAGRLVSGFESTHYITLSHSERAALSLSLPVVHYLHPSGGC